MITPKTPNICLFMPMMILTVVLAIPARAGSIPITYSFTGMGTVESATNTTLTLFGQFSGIVVSNNPSLDNIWNPVGYTDHSVADLTTGLLNGNFTMTFSNGDTLLGNVFEDVSALIASPTATGPFTQTLTFTGGTGEFAGATGSVSGSGFAATTQTAASGSGTVNISAVPEPAPAALLIGGLAFGIAGRWRRMRGQAPYSLRLT